MEGIFSHFFITTALMHILLIPAQKVIHRAAYVSFNVNEHVVLLRDDFFSFTKVELVTSVAFLHFSLTIAMFLLFFFVTFLLLFS
jgi:hypothetical protein